MRNCKECYVARRRSNKEQGVKYDQREYFMEDAYGITTQQYSEILESQGGGCAICGAPPPIDTRKKHLVVDHNHETGEVRGLLCDTCNRGLGLLGDNLHTLCSAVDYLLKYERKTV